MIKLIIFDIDGVLTDGMVLVDESGREQKRICLNDIDAVNRFRREGFLIAAVTGEATPMAEYFSKKIAWDSFTSGCKDKLTRVKGLAEEYHLERGEIAYIGDGIYDVPALEFAGWPASPANAIREAREASKIRLIRCGGGGCVAELFDEIMKINGKEQ